MLMYNYNCDIYSVKMNVILTENSIYIFFKFSFIFQLMSKVAVLVGRKVTEELFLQRFLSLCEDKQNYVRKVSF